MAAFAAPSPTENISIPTSVKVTCYAPGADPNIEGPFATSKPPAEGGRAIPFTLDDVRLGQSKYVTLAANPMHYGKWFNMGSVTYVSNLDGRRYTISNVVGYVHDTGCAFKGGNEKGSCCAKYNTCADVYRKMDVAYGDFRQNNANKGLVNSGAFCGSRDATWTQIGGPLTTAPTVTGGEYVGINQAPTSPIPPSLSQPPYASAPPPPQYAQQQGGAQPGQYFNNAYTPVPAGQPFPGIPTQDTFYTASSSQGGAASLGQSLLDLLKPITGVQSGTPVKPFTVSTGTSSGSALNPSASNTQVNVTPLSTENGSYNPSQTFSQTYLEAPRPSATGGTSTIVVFLEALKNILLRMLEILRLR